MKVFKIALIVLSIVIGTLLLLLLIATVNHRIRLKSEEKLFSPLGTMATVDGKQMSVYVEGEGEKTLVFMSGGGTCSPILDFRTLYSRLSDSYRVAVVEKFGYGFSDIIDEERPIDAILEDTRAALSAVGVEGPYILCPHSMSGIEALYWTQKYPEEVSAIVGLDMAVPEFYESMKISAAQLSLVQFTSEAGITRLIPGLSESDAIRGGRLTEQEKAIYRAVFYRRTMTDTMIKEMLSIKDSAALVAQGEPPRIPILLFCSDATGTGFEKDEWIGIQNGFAKTCADAQVICLDCGHYVHNYEYERIAKKIKEAFAD